MVLFIIGCCGKPEFDPGHQKLLVTVTDGLQTFRTFNFILCLRSLIFFNFASHLFDVNGPFQVAITKATILLNGFVARKPS